MWYKKFGDFSTEWIVIRSVFFYLSTKLDYFEIGLGLRDNPNILAKLAEAGVAQNLGQFQQHSYYTFCYCESILDFAH